MKFLKSKSGFTLIELLVVIGILAVLAAIAIPSVAGLIDRANVSADKTNANEMTNAIERFTSEYELYCQDIASGVIKADTTDFDSAQGRVYNVTKVKTRAGVETLEVAQDAVVADDQIAIYRDTKYPANALTARAIVENYTKTSSSTFEPKQSDMHYWYSPDCGIVVFDEPDASVEELNAQIQSGQDAKGNILDNDTQWIDLTVYIKKDIPNQITQSGTYYVGVTSSKVGDYSGATEVYTDGVFPTTVSDGDVYVYGDYEYRYNYAYVPTQNNSWVSFEEAIEVSYQLGGGEYYSYKIPLTDGWSARVLHTNKANYETPLSEINGKPLVSLQYTYGDCKMLQTPPTIPTTVIVMYGTFYNSGITALPNISACNNLKTLRSAFRNSKITRVENFSIPASVVDMNCTFADTKIETAPVIPQNIIYMSETFLNCKNLSGEVEINATPTKYAKCFYNVANPIKIFGNSSNLSIIAKTDDCSDLSENDYVQIKN